MYSVDVVVATHNVADYIYQCLSSLVEQATGLDIRVLLVDDASSDRTLDQVEGFKVDHPDAKLTVRHTQAVGPAVARNEGVKSSSGADYLCFVDGDDMVSAKALEVTVSQLDFFRADFACPRVIAYEDAGRYYYEHDNASFRNSILEGWPSYVTNSRASPELLSLETSMCFRVFRRKFFDEAGLSFTNIRLCEDVAPSRRAFLLADAILLTDAAYYFYRQNRTGQRTSVVADHSLDMVTAIKLALDEGLSSIIDDAQGLWLSNKLCLLASWGVELLPAELLPEYARLTSDQFDRIPLGWWRAVDGEPRVHDVTRRFSYCYGQRRSRRSRERIIYNPRFRYVDRLVRDLWKRS